MYVCTVYMSAPYFQNHVYTFVYVSTYSTYVIHVYVSTLYACMYICLFVCIYVCMYVCGVPQLNGVILAGRGQSLDLHSSISHLAPAARSEQSQRNVVGEGTWSLSIFSTAESTIVHTYIHTYCTYIHTYINSYYTSFIAAKGADYA